MPKTQFLVAKDYVMVGHTGSPTDILAPGERVRFNKDADSHKHIASLLEEGDEQLGSLLELREIDLEAERKAEAERKELLEKADKIAAEDAQRRYQEENAAAVSVGAGFDPSEHTVEEVLDHLSGADAGEVRRVKDAEASDRDRKMIADYKEG